MASAAFPFVTVEVDTDALAPTAQRSTGVVAVLGKGGTQNGVSWPANQPRHLTNLGNAAELLNENTALFRSLQTLFSQPLVPDKIYVVRVSGTKWDEALASIAAIDDITGVALAEEHSAPAIQELVDHLVSTASAGNKRVGYAAVDPNLAPENGKTYAEAVIAHAKTLTGGATPSTPRLVMVAAREATGDAATATMAAVHARDPHVSPVLKPIGGLSIPLEAQFDGADIIALSNAGIVPVIDPQLMPGEGLHLAEARLFSTHDLQYIDQVRTLDDIEFRLRAGLIGLVGDARITRVGLTRVKNRIEGILTGRVRASVITRYNVVIPVLEMLLIPVDSRSEADRLAIEAARSNRSVSIHVDVTYGPAVHRLDLTLVPAFA